LRVLISLLSFNHSEDTIECLKNIQKLSRENIAFDILLIENGSIIKEKNILLDYVKNDDAYIFLNSKKDFKDLKNLPIKKNIYLDLKKNIGFTGGHNISFDYIKDTDHYEYLWVLNNDALPEKNSLVNLISFSEKNKPCISGSVIMDYENRDIIQDLGTKSVSNIRGFKAAKLKDSKDGLSILVHAVCGASMLVDENIIKKGIKFDEAFFLYVDENEMGYRCAKLGINSYIVLNSLVFHKGSIVLKKDSAQKLYYLVRNLLYLKRKHFSLGSVLFSVFHLGLMTIYKYKFSPQSVKAYSLALYDFYKGNMGESIHSIKD